MKYIHDLFEISEDANYLFGGKATSISKLSRFHFNVPSGFVISTEAFDGLVDKDLIIASLKNTNDRHISEVSTMLQGKLIDSDFPKKIDEEIIINMSGMSDEKFAVRSSATIEDTKTSSFAGQFDSYLNIGYPDIPTYIKKCWVSTFNERAIHYLLKKNIDVSDLSMAVIIQKMVPSNFSGVCFSANPVTKDKDKIIIEVASGLGESLVSGEIIPDIYEISKNNRRIIYSEIENTNCVAFSKEKVFQLVEIVLAIEKSFKKPVDVEWAFFQEKFYILQTRPITNI